MGSKKKGCGAFTHFHMFVKFIQNCSPTLSIFTWSYAHFTSSIHIHSLLYSSAGSHRFINSEKEIVSNLQKRVLRSNGDGLVFYFYRLCGTRSSETLESCNSLWPQAQRRALAMQVAAAARAHAKIATWQLHIYVYIYIYMTVNT